MSDTPHKHRKDPFYKKSKKQQYRARSAYKLLDIYKKFNIFKRAFYILDIGSSPGSWLQVSRKLAEENLDKYNDQFYHRDNFKIMGVDIKKVSPIDNVNIIKMDINNPKIQNEIYDFFKGEKLDLILSDASINKSGNRFSDQIRQIRLCNRVLELTQKNLKYKGILLIKIFQGEDFNNFITDLRKNFLYIKTYKPIASKKKSNEIYIIGFKKK